jgi:hypothetical protein
MEKILDSEFRNTLYKSLVEAGYDKKEAQKIIGVKYFSALKENTKESVNKLMESIESEKFDFDVITITAAITELTKLKDIIS